MTSLSRIAWYARRLGRMSPAETAWRARDQALQLLWTRRQVRPGQIPCGFSGLPVLEDRRFVSVLPPGSAGLVPASARAAIVAAAGQIMAGEWETLGVLRTDLASPDWFADPVTGRRSPASRYAFRVDHRSEAAVGNIKQVWEISRLQHLTLVACAYCLTGDEDYAWFASSQLEGWWRANPFLSGVNWTSGIEVGIRLLNFVWIRRLLASWPQASCLFEDSSLALRQIRWHQEYLAAFVSRGSSANNHVIAEAAGQFAASCAFPWFPESGRWLRASGRLLTRSLAANTFGSGTNRELASDYHGFVFELGAYAVAEAAAAGVRGVRGVPGLEDTRVRLCAMADCMAALVDSEGQPPRQGDSDEGRVVLLDAPAHNRWPELLDVAAALFGRLDWWPRGSLDCSSGFAAGVLVSGLASSGPGPGPVPVSGRPRSRPDRFADAGITLLRTDPLAGDGAPEIWVRCDGGPHGFGSLAAHAHADALSVEVRYGGVEVLADPGTYCYHGEPEWREYFRSTLAHNTLEIGGRSQSVPGGPFLWQRHARSAVTETGGTGAIAAWAGSAACWSGEHDGYGPVTHRRSVRLNREDRVIDIVDTVEAAGTGTDVRLAFHFGPDVHVGLHGSSAVLNWPAPQSPAACCQSACFGPFRPGAAWLQLPGQLRWTLHRGETGPIRGWYSHGLGQRVPAVMLLGAGILAPPLSPSSLVTRMAFIELPRAGQRVARETPATNPAENP